MKAGPYVFAILAFGALSPNAALAAHHHAHHVKGATGGQQGSGPTFQAAPHSIADNPNSGTGQSEPPVRNHAKTGTSTQGETGNFPPVVHGNHAVAPAAGGSEPGTGSAIDTTITVHQGRDFRKNPKASTDLKTRLTGKPNSVAGPGTVATPGSAIVPGRDHNHQHALDHQQKPIAGVSSGHTRNAIGALVDHGKTVDHWKTVDHGNIADHRATAPTGTPIANAGSVPTSGGPQGGATSPGPNVKPTIGNIPTNNAGPAGAGSTASPIVRHDRGPDTVNTAIANGPAINGATINGTGMLHPQFKTAAIGGPAKIVAAGVVAGTGFRIRHP